MTRATAAILCCLAFAHIANAASLTGSSIYTMCTSKDKEMDGMCAMWTSGFVLGLNAAQQLATMKKMPSPTCLPEGVTGEQARLIILKVLHDNPRFLNLNADAIGAFALSQAFPCTSSH